VVGGQWSVISGPLYGIRTLSDVCGLALDWLRGELLAHQLSKRIMGGKRADIQAVWAAVESRKCLMGLQLHVRHD
jgi:hypothetical protein